MSIDLLEQYLAFLVIEKGLRPKTLEAYTRDLRDFLDFLEERGRKADETTITGPLTLFLVHLHEQGLSPRSLARKTSALRGFYRFLQREGKTLEDPTSILERPKIGKPLPQVLSRQEVEAILTQPDPETTLGKRDRALLEVLYATGIRESELIDLHLGSLHHEGEFLSVVGKGGRERVIPIGRLALEAVQNYLIHARPRLVRDITRRNLFLNPYGNALSRMGVWKIVKKYVTQAGIVRRISPHVFRHSCATHMLEGGASILAIQEMLGHVDVATTQIYTHLTGQDLKRIHQQAHPRGS